MNWYNLVFLLWLVALSVASLRDAILIEELTKRLNKKCNSQSDQ